MLRSEVRLARVALALVDVLCWFVATAALLAARYDFWLSRIQWSLTLLYPLAAGVLQLISGFSGRLYRGGSPVGSFVEARALAAVVALVGVVSGLTLWLSFPDFPRGMALMVPPAALVLMAAVRFVARAVLAHGLSARDEDSEPVIIFGAGNTGRQLGQLIYADADAPYYIVGYVDDDPLKRHLNFGYGRVIGTSDDMIQLARDKGVSTIVLAISAVKTGWLRDLSNELEHEGLRLMVVPPVKDIIGGRMQLGDLRELEITDLLGRDPIVTDLSKIAGYLTDKVVLITGAGGSIGAEIARQVHRFGPKELVCLDRDESALHSVQLSLYGSGLLDTPAMVLCDIRDQESLDEAFARHRPDVVFHAAALKHLPMLEQYPDEGWKTNVLGTLNVLECAADHHVEHFVNISTDKAADATSVLGKTKRMAEELTSWFAANDHGTYLSVRFGNVLGSRGSVLHTFSKQIQQGGPVTVVHPEVTRYFMTIPEACQLVIQAGAIGSPGDVLVLNMGEPVKIADVAERLIRQSGKPIDIIYTGLRRGEKLDEVLFSRNEDATRTEHALISRVGVPSTSPHDILQNRTDLTTEREAVA